MAKVIILTYDEFTDKRTKVKFSPTKVTRNGHVLILGVAVMPDEFAKQHYEGREMFEVQYDQQEAETLVEIGKKDETPPPVQTGPELVKDETPKPEPPPQVIPEGAEVAEITALDDGAKWYTADELSSLTIEKLQAVAKAEEIDVSKCKLKDEFINTILAAGQEE